MKLDELCKAAFERSVANGFGTELEMTGPGYAASALKVHMLMVTELAEATEEVRAGNPPLYFLAKNTAAHRNRYPEGNVVRFVPAAVTPEAIAYTLAMAQEQGFELSELKPEGEAVELADAVIRVADWFGRHGWSMEAVVRAKNAFNATRGHRHGGKLA